MQISELGITDYLDTWEEMQRFTETRAESTEDEIWLLQHNPVYTQGTSCHALPDKNDLGIPVVHTDRGGQITYHGPGQLIVYFMVDIRRRKSGPKSFVHCLEQIVIDFLQDYGLTAMRKPGAPGVYVSEKKIAALGLRISRGFTYHGLSLNVDMDLTPFDYIDPCGFPGLAVTRISDYAPMVDFELVMAEFKNKLIKFF